MRKKEKIYLISLISLIFITLFLAFLLLFDEVKEPIPKVQGNGLSREDIRFLNNRIEINMPGDYEWINVGNCSITSMYPTIRKTSFLIFLKTDKDTEINIDDIIVFDVPEKYYVGNSTQWVHRVIDINGEQFTTKGDANKIIDPFKTRKENITDIVVAIIY